MRLRRNTTRSGFTLAEVAVTLVIVGVGLVLVMQGMNTAKLTAAHTYNRKVARQLALLTLGEVQSGLFWEDIDERLTGSYSEEGFPEWYWEVAVGDDALTDLSEPDATLEHDSWRRDEYDDDDEDEDEESEQPFEKVRIQVTFPKLGEWPNFITLERWIPWAQVYGEDDDEEDGDGGAASDES